MTTDLLTLARAAAHSGQSWNDWTASDEVQDAVLADGTSFDTDAIERAFCDARRERRVSVDGWRVMWTTAPTDYDWFGTETLEIVPEQWRGRTLRKVVADPNYANGQADRYGSGCHMVSDEDPRVADARATERRERDDRERAEHAAKRDAGLAWIRTATETEMDDFDTFEARGVRYDDVRKERARRAGEAETSRKANEWARCVALVQNGVTIVDEGESAKRGTYGIIPGRLPHVYQNVKIEIGYPSDDADRANVYGDGRDGAGSLLMVADWIASGRLRLARPGEVFAPHAVVARIGSDKVREIKRVDVNGVVVWVGRPTFASESLVLDGNGHMVRSKKIREVALRAI